MFITNTAMAEAWNGYEGQHWADHQERYDEVNQEFNRHLLAAVGVSDRVLDVGCGNGQLTILAAAKGAGALGVDLSAPMLARARSAGAPDVEFVRGDAQVFPFERDAFDVALSRFGVMFFADPVAAFTNIRGALRPGGRLAMLTLQPFDRGDLGTVFADVFGDRRPSGLALADKTEIHGVLGGAGYTEITVRQVDAIQWWGQDAEDAGGFLADWGPMRAAAPTYDGDLRVALVAAMRRFGSPAGVTLTGTAWLTEARAQAVSRGSSPACGGPGRRSAPPDRRLDLTSARRDPPDPA